MDFFLHVSLLLGFCLCGCTGYTVLRLTMREPAGSRKEDSCCSAKRGRLGHASCARTATRLRPAPTTKRHGALGTRPAPTSTRQN